MLLTCHSLGKFLFHPLRVYSGKAGLGLLVYWVSPWAGLEKNKRKFSTENPGSLEDETSCPAGGSERNEFRQEENPNRERPGEIHK